THWAAAAQASSFYGDRTVPAVRLPLPVIRPGQVIVPTPFRLVPDAQETERLRREVEELKRRVAELEKKAGSGK
ncbi:MAG: coiled-coil domain-containing protein, partial [Planctomycetota bacterium]